MSWESQDWVQDDSNFYGYPTPKLSDLSYDFDTSDIYCYFKIEQGVFYGYPHSVFGVAPDFDIDKVYHYFQLSDNFYGYPAALGIAYEPLGAFRNCSNLTDVTLPDSIVEIGDYSFSNCTSLSEISIPPSCTYIGYGAFSGTDLSELIVPPDVKIMYNSVPDGCDLQACPHTISGISSSTNILYELNENPVDKLLALGITVNMSGGISRQVNEIITDATTDTLKSNQTAHAKFKYTGLEISSYTYSVDYPPSYYDGNGVFECFQQYYYDSQISFNVGGNRQYTKITSDGAIGVMGTLSASGSLYTSGIFISTDPNAVTFTYNTTASNLTVQYAGLTWYVSTTGYAWAGNLTDSTGTLIKYPDILGYDYTNSCIDSQSVIDILEYVHARSVS